MKAIVDEDLCISCGLCAELCPEVFRPDSETGISKVIASPVPVNAEESCRLACEQCPVEAIIIEDY